jgi:hypothetical protein
MIYKSEEQRAKSKEQRVLSSLFAFGSSLFALVLGYNEATLFLKQS